MPNIHSKRLIDTNILIAAEDHSSPAGHPDGAAASKLLRSAQALGFTICVSSGTQSDFARSGARQQTRAQELERYYLLDPIPVDPEVARTGRFPSDLGSNDAADLEVLCALASGAADFLVTQDVQLRARAGHVVSAERVLSLAEANDWLDSLKSHPSSLPNVSIVPGYSIFLQAAIFDSLRVTYPDFDGWWRKSVAGQARDVALIGESRDPLGIAVFKPETDAPVSATLKICTFKARSDQGGSKLGEHLLKASLDYARKNGHKSVYMEVNPASELTAWLPQFGFTASSMFANNGDGCFVKDLGPQVGQPAMKPLTHAVTFGPGAAIVERAFMVPIRRKWHEILFPEVPDAQMPLFAAPDRPCGNAIRKAYLSNGNTNKLEPGDFLTFLLTGDGPSRVTVTGIVEAVTRSVDPSKIVDFVGSRTVYSAEEIASLCQTGPVLAIRFRLDRVLDPPIPREDLVAQGVIKRPPQSIMQLSEEGVLWARGLTE